jgi:hypothetical protein
MTSATPSFDEWVEYCFTQGYADFRLECGSPGYDEADSRAERFVGLDPRTLAGYLRRLFSAPAALAERYTDGQIAGATWFLFGCASEYFSALRSAVVPPDEQVACMASVATLYTDLYDRICCKRASDPDGEHTNTVEVDMAVYMIWDMDCIAGAIIHPKEAPHLLEPTFAVLDTVLRRCRTSTCQISALHGLGHVHEYHPQRTERMIDAFLAGRRPADWVREYARWARVGRVQ